VIVRERPIPIESRSLCAPMSGFSWRPDLADHRDFLLEHEAIISMIRKLKRRRGSPTKLPRRVDWREYCGPVEDQAGLPTSAAHACVGLVQQFERFATGRDARLSRLFVHYVASRMEGAANTSLRIALKAAVRFGIPPEKYWPYEAERIAREPDAFAYSFQRDYTTIRYVRLDSRVSTGQDVLNRVRFFLSAGFAIAFGFPVSSAVSDHGEIPYPVNADSMLGGQAAIAIGFDDRLRIRSDKGALLLRNSWGKAWGDGGYGWIPYTYVRERLAADFWTLFKPSWLESGEFEIPRASD
jgi:C1A family cysteine protease